MYCDAADQVATASTTWHVRQPESALPLIEFALSHAGVWIPPWQLTFEHFPLAEEGANDGDPPVLDWYAPATAGTDTWYRLLSMCVAKVATQSIEEGTYPVWQLPHEVEVVCGVGGGAPWHEVQPRGVVLVHSTVALPWQYVAHVALFPLTRL